MLPTPSLGFADGVVVIMPALLDRSSHPRR